MSTRGDESWLRENLAAIAVPEGDPRDRLTATHDRNRRRRRQRLAAIAGASAVVAVVVATVAAFAAFRAGPTSIPVATSPDQTDPSYRCSPPTDDAKSGRIPRGAVAVRLCPGPVTAGQVSPPLPDTLLTERVGQLLISTPRETSPPSSSSCSSAGGFAYRLTFFYPDRSPRAVDGETGGCGDGGLLDRFRLLLADQLSTNDIGLDCDVEDIRDVDVDAAGVKFPQPRDVVETWIANAELEPSGFVMTPDSRTAFVLRDDGGAYTRIDVAKSGDDFEVVMARSCSA